MSQKDLLCWGGWAAVVAGVLTALFWFIHPDPSLTDVAARTTVMWKTAYSLFLVILVLTVFFLMAWFAAYNRRGRFKKAAFAGFILSVVGTMLFVGAGLFDGFVTSALAGNSAISGLISMDGQLFVSVAPVLMLGGMLFALGFIILGVIILMDRIFPRWAGLLLVVSSPILGLSPLMPASLRTTGSVLWGIALVWLGYFMWKRRSELD